MRAAGDGCGVWCQEHRLIELRGVWEVERGQVVGQGGGDGLRGVGDVGDGEKR